MIFLIAVWTTSGASAALLTWATSDTALDGKQAHKICFAPVGHPEDQEPVRLLHWLVSTTHVQIVTISRFLLAGLASKSRSTGKKSMPVWQV